MATSEHALQDRELPPSDVLYAFGAVNLCWARLDAISTACLCTLNEIDPGEFIVLMGRLDALAKLRKIKQILEMRGDELRAKTIRQSLKQLETLKDDRNAITHGFYLGMTNEGSACIALYSEIELGTDNTLGTKLTTLTREQLAGHVGALSNCTTTLCMIFDTEKLRGLLGLPSVLKNNPVTRTGEDDR